MRLLDRNDTSLAVALIAGALVIFQRPLQHIIDIARAAEEQYHIDLIPGLTVLVAAFAFHQYKKRQQAKAAALAAEAQARLERSRAEELERLVAFGRALGAALDAPTVRQILWRYLPHFSPEHEFWLLRRLPDRWERFLEDQATSETRAGEDLEIVAQTAMGAHAATDPHGEGVDIAGDVCFPMILGDATVGVLGVRNQPVLSPSRRRAIGAAAALVAIALRNVQLIAETKEHSLRDALTGCFNRAHALQELDREIRRARRTGRPLSLLLFDIDNFKDVNDRYGHLAGDTMLASVGRLLSRVLRATDIKCRYGGDEFLVILPDTPILGARPVSEALLKEIAALHTDVQGDTVSASASAGLAMASGEDSAVDLVARADEALYRAKRAGRNQLAIAGQELVTAVKAAG